MNLTLQTITVEAKSKFGVLDGTTNKWFNPKDKDLLADFIVGQSYNVELAESNGKDGKTYTNITKIVGARGPSADVPAIVAPVFANTPVAPAAPEVKAPYKPFKKAWGGKKSDAPATDWAAKDRSQLIGGLSHDAATMAVAVYNTKGGDIVAIYKEVLIGLIEIRAEVK